MCDILKELYREVFGDEFRFDLDYRIKLQKMVYIMENLGVHIGDYGFVWADFGPYSIALDDDAYRCYISPSIDGVKFSEWAKMGMEIVKQIIGEGKEYDEKEWLERVASLHYLKYVFKCHGNMVEKKLVEFKPYMDDHRANELALNWADKIEEYLLGA